MYKAQIDGHLARIEDLTHALKDAQSELSDQQKETTGLKERAHNF